MAEPLVRDEEGGLVARKLDELLERVDHTQLAGVAHLLVCHQPAELAQHIVRDEDGRMAQLVLRRDRAQHALAVAVPLLHARRLGHPLQFEQDDGDDDGHVCEADKDQGERNVERRVKAKHAARQRRRAAPVLGDVVKGFDEDGRQEGEDEQRVGGRRDDRVVDPLEGTHREEKDQVEEARDERNREPRHAVRRRDRQQPGGDDQAAHQLEDLPEVGDLLILARERCRRNRQQRGARPRRGRIVVRLGGGRAPIGPLGSLARLSRRRRPLRGGEQGGEQQWHADRPDGDEDAREGRDALVLR